jgi:hypothetical protein
MKNYFYPIILIILTGTVLAIELSRTDTKEGDLEKRIEKVLDK